MGHNRYERYIASDEWSERRKLVLQRSKGWCEICRRAKATQVHHLTYKNLGDEPLGDLQAVCLSCHARQHPDKLDGRFIPIVEAGCDMCPNDAVEVFWEGRTQRTFCPKCGNSTMKTYPKRQKDRRDTPRRKPPSRAYQHPDQRQKEWERVQWIKAQQAKQRTR